MCGPGPVLNWVSGVPSGCSDRERDPNRLAGDDRAGGLQVDEPVGGRRLDGGAVHRGRAAAAGEGEDGRGNGQESEQLHESPPANRKKEWGGEVGAELEHDLGVGRERDRAERAADEPAADVGADGRAAR